jgi:hypothetical protein
MRTKRLWRQAARRAPIVFAPTRLEPVLELFVIRAREKANGRERYLEGGRNAAASSRVMQRFQARR